MRMFRHDNHLLWLSVLAVAGMIVYVAFSQVSRQSSSGADTGATANTHGSRGMTAAALVPATGEQSDAESARAHVHAAEAAATTTATDMEAGVSSISADGSSSQLTGRPAAAAPARKVRFAESPEITAVHATGDGPTELQLSAHTPGAPPPSASPEQPRFVFLDLAKQDFLKDPFTGRVVLQVRPDVAPRTCANFVKLCEDKKYVNTPFHRVIKDFMLQGGDIVHQDGSGSYSIYGGEGSTFEDESFALKHDQAGVLSMANSGPHTNGSQFFITTCATPHLDGKHVVFGKVVQGMEFVHDIEREMTDANNAPIRKCYIMNCGVLQPHELQLPNQTGAVGAVGQGGQGVRGGLVASSSGSPHAAVPFASGSALGTNMANTPPIEPSPFSL